MNRLIVMELILILAVILFRLVLQLVIVGLVQLLVLGCTATFPSLANAINQIIYGMAEFVIRILPPKPSQFIRQSVCTRTRARSVSGPTTEPMNLVVVPSAPSEPPNVDPGSHQQEQGNAARRMKSNRGKIVRKIGLAAILMLLPLLAIEALGPSHLLRMAMNDLKARTGIEITFARATGGLMRGQVQLHEVTAKRAGHRSSNFTLSARTIEIRFSLWSLIWSKTAFHNIKIESVAGTYERLSLGETGPSRRPFEINRLDVADCRINIIDRSVEPISFQLDIDSMASAPIRSRHVLMDLLFRSSVSGKIDNHPFEVSTTASDTGRDTKWEFTRLPASFASVYLGGPFRWINGGSISVLIHDRWTTHPRNKLHSTWRLQCHDLTATITVGETSRFSSMAQRAANTFSRHPQSMDLGFEVELDLDRNDLKTDSTADLKALGKLVAEAAIDGFKANLKVGVEETIDKGKETVRDAMYDIKARLKPSSPRADQPSNEEPSLKARRQTQDR